MDQLIEDLLKIMRNSGTEGGVNCKRQHMRDVLERYTLMIEKNAHSRCLMMVQKNQRMYEDDHK